MIININRTNRGNIGSVDGVDRVKETSMSAESKAAIKTFQDTAKLQEDIAKKTKTLKDASYISDSSLAMTKEIEQLKKDIFNNRVSPEGYANEFITKVSEIQNKYIAGAPSLEAKSTLTNNLGASRNSMYKDAFSKESKAILDNVNNKADQAVLSLTNSVFDNPESINSALENLRLVVESKKELLSPDELNSYAEKAKKEIFGAYMRGTIDKNQDDARRLLESGALGTYFDEKELATFNKSLEQKNAQEDTKQKQFEESVRDGTIQALSDELLDGTLTEATIVDAAKKGFIRSSDALTLKTKLETSIKNGQNLKFDIADLDAQIAAGQPVYVGDKDVRKTLDLNWDKIVSPMIKPGEELKVAANYIERYDYIPTTVKNNMLGKLNAGKPKDVVETARALEKILKTNSSIAKEFKDKDLLKINMVAEYANAGMDPENIISNVNNAIIEKGTTEQALRKAELKDLSMKEGEFTEYFRIDPDIPLAMKSEWKSLVTGFYMGNRGVSIEAAQKTAYTIMKQNWGVSDINGDKEFTKYAPERYYQPRTETSTKWMRDQLIAEVKKGVPEADADTAFIVVNEASITKDPKKPSYHVFYLNDLGVPTPAFPKNSWRPDHKTRK